MKFEVFGKNKKASNMLEYCLCLSLVAGLVMASFSVYVDDARTAAEENFENTARGIVGSLPRIVPVSVSNPGEEEVECEFCFKGACIIIPCPARGDDS